MKYKYNILFNNINMDSKQLNERIVACKSYDEAYATLVENKQYSDDDTCEHIIQHMKKLSNYSHYQHISSHIELTCAFIQFGKITTEHLHTMLSYIQSSYIHDDEYREMCVCLRTSSLKCNGTTLTRIRPHNNCECIALVLDNIFEHKTLINDEGFHIICSEFNKKLLTSAMDKIFKSGYVPSATSIDMLLLNTYNVDSCLIDMIHKFDMKLTEEQLEKCAKHGIYLNSGELKIAEIEQMCGKYKLTKFRKYIPKNAVLTQQCLYNACSMHANIQSIKTLVIKYGLKPDAKCLELSTSIMENNKTNMYLIQGGAMVSHLCLSNVIENHKNYKKCPVYYAWKEQHCSVINEDVPQIQGIE